MLDAAATTRVATHNGAADSLARSATPCGGNARWAVCYTHPQAERWAEQNLTRIGYTAYLPLMTVQRRDRAIRSLTHSVTVPLFSRYLFVQQPNREHWRPIREAPGVHSVLTDGNRLQYAPEGAVEALQASEASRGSISQPSALWRPGAPCRLLEGPFSQHQAVVVSVAKKRARVAMICFGALHEVSVSVDLLVPRVEE
jgi:transcription antitermination factor NusG